MRVTVNIPDPVGREAAEVARSREISVSFLYAEAVKKHLCELRREQAVGRIGRLIGSDSIAEDATREIERERNVAGRSLG